MNQRDDGGTAFPMQDMQAIHAYASAKVAGVDDTDERDRLYTQARAQAVGGMSLRDYFAARAMAIMWDAYDKGYCGLNGKDLPNTTVIAQGAYQLADAMLEARTP
jgi:hypothetical protein